MVSKAVCPGYLKLSKEGYPVCLRRSDYDLVFAGKTPVIGSVIISILISKLKYLIKPFILPNDLFMII